MFETMLEPGLGHPHSHWYGRHNPFEPSEGEHRIRDLNDEINKDLREKGYWEDQLPGRKVGKRGGGRIPQPGSTK